MGAKDLKNIAAQVRRTETALRNLSVILALGKDDHKALLTAATVLASRGRKLGVEATQAKRVEEAKRHALDKASVEASRMMADWPSSSALDKVAICLATQMEGNLRQDLQRDSKLEWSLDYWTKQALREIPEHAAGLAVHEGRPVTEVMVALRERYEQIRARPGTTAFAQRWQAGMDAQSASASDSSATQCLESGDRHHQRGI